MLYKRLYWFIPLLIAAVIFSGCKKNEEPAGPQQSNESEILVKYLEANGDYTNTIAPAMISAADVHQGLINGAKQIVIDIRTVCDFKNLGHIEGAVNLSLSAIPGYYAANKLDTLDKVIITCATGQNSGYAVALLRLSGLKNVYSMMWGMTSWNPDFDSWTHNTGNSYTAQFETTTHEKNAAGALPNLTTGKTTAEEILKARMDDLFLFGFDEVETLNETVFLNLSNYFVINYVSFQSYAAGHIPGAVQYTPQQDLKLETYLKTLPTNKTIVLYCNTGQTSAQIAAYLKLIGYDVKSILFGSNGMDYSTMTGKKFTAAEINNFTYVK